MRFTPIRSGELVSPSQKAVVLSTLILIGKTQEEWAKDEGLHRSELSRMVNGRLVTREPYVRKMNALVRRTHPVRMAA